MAVHIRALTPRWVRPSAAAAGWKNPAASMTVYGGFHGDHHHHHHHRHHHHHHHHHLYDDESVQRYLRRLVREHAALSEALRRARLDDAPRRELSKRHGDLAPVARGWAAVRAALGDLGEVTSLVHGTAGTKDEDQQMTQLLKDEEVEISNRIEVLKRDLIKVLIPSDPLDSSHVVLEVSAGRTTGGDICQQFTKEMFDMYQGFADYKNWSFFVLNYSQADYGGLHHAAVQITGDDVYRHLKHEGGTHRVTRIPHVGLSSRMQRIHTGTMAVIVLPQPQEFELSIDAKDLRVDTFRSSGAGGQSVNTTDSAVRIVHIPTGTMAECQQSRSQLQNRDTAMAMLRARLHQSATNKETEKRLTERKKQVGTRAQSERIRTYNFSQDRVTDHRTAYTTRDLKEFMRGGEALDDMICNVLEHREREALLDLVEKESASEPLLDLVERERESPC